MPRSWVLGLLAAAATGGAVADDAAILRCRQIGDMPQRLTCYDAIVVTNPAGSSPAAARSPERFGIPDRAESQVEAIDSRIPGRFDGWGNNQTITLENGQVWQIADGSKGFLNLTSPKVRIRRGMLGAYYLEIEGSNLSPRVKRVQ